MNHNNIKTKNTNLQQELKTNILGSNSHLKRLEWPRASIPRTVKKLSWDDELETTKDGEVSTFMDASVSVTPIGKTAIGVMGMGM